MKKTSIKLTLAALAMGAVTLLSSVPTYAEQKAEGTDKVTVGQTAQFSIDVSQVLTLSSVSFTGTGSSNIIEVDTQKVGTGSISATVTSNVNYTINLKAASSTALTSSNGSIPAKSGTDIAAGKAGWGIQKSGDSSYTALTAGGDTFYTSTTANNNANVTNFPVGVSVDSTIPNGVYSTTVVVTAIAKP